MDKVLLRFNIKTIENKNLYSIVCKKKCLRNACHTDISRKNVDKNKSSGIYNGIMEKNILLVERYHKFSPMTMNPDLRNPYL